MLPPATKAEQLQICVDSYSRAREWLLTKESTLPIIMEINDMEKFQKIREFDTFHNTYFIPPMVEMYRNTLLSINKNWTDPQTWGLYRSQLDMREINMTVYLMADDDIALFQNIFRERLEKFGSREGLLRCAIAFPD